MQPVLEFFVEYHLFHFLSGIAYAIFAAGLIRLGFIHHEARVNGDKEVKQYPKGYFTFLAIQLVPLLMTGLVISDFYVVGTRLLTLLSVVVVYLLTSSENGSLLTKRNVFWIRATMIAVTVLIIAWGYFEPFRNFVRDFEPAIAWGSIAMMILFVFKGQVAVAKELFDHFVGGNYTVKRLNLQFVRLAGFALQSLAYWFTPSKAAPVVGLDPIMLQGLIGTGGVAFVLVSAFVGYVRGTGERRGNKRMLARHAVRTV